MISRLSDAVWREGERADEEDNSASWTRSVTCADDMAESRDEIPLSCLKSLLDDDWFAVTTSTATDTAPGSSFNHGFTGIAPSDACLLLPSPPVDSCSSSAVFDLDPSVHHPFFPHKSALSSLLSVASSNPFDGGFDFVTESSTFLHPANSSGFGVGMMGFPNVQINSQDLLPMSESSSLLNPMSFDSFDNVHFPNRGKLLRPLEIFPPVGAQPTLFQKRALRQNSSILGRDAEHEKDRRTKVEDEFDDVSIDGSCLNYDSEDAYDAIEHVKMDEDGDDAGPFFEAGNSSIATCSMNGGSGEAKGRRKGLPAKNLMAERRRRKKLNDRLYMLRSVVPKISKMDRASILGDAIEYLKELLQRINDLHNELESTNSSIPASSTASFHPLTPTPHTLPCRIKEELSSSSLPSPNGQPARVEVRLREGRAVNIHMFCARRPGLLLSTMRALDSLGLDIQQAVISCFNGFALDVFRAEQSKDGPAVLPEEIKEVLLHSASFQNAL